MAGGKETPRQKLIGLMYLVLLAMLALQVSSVVLDKFQFLNGSLEVASQQAEKRNAETLKRIQQAVEEAKNAPEDVAVLKQAQALRQKTTALVSHLRQLKQELIDKTGGRDEHNKLVGAKEEEPVALHMLGPGESKSGKAYALKTRLNSFSDSLNLLMKTLKEEKRFEPLALDGKEHPLFKNDPEQKIKDFAHINFAGTPLVAALAVLSEQESRIMNFEAEALSLMADKVGAEIIPIDRVRPVVRQQSKVIVAGMDYEAEMFMAAYSSSFKPEMTYGGNNLDVDGQGVGNIKFKPQGGNYDANGLSKRTWKGTIKYPKPGGGDSVYTVEQEYYVLRPAIQVTSGTKPILYQDCANKLNVAVPALGANYRPNISATGAKIHESNGQGAVSVVPSTKNVILKVANNGTAIGNVEYKAIKVPKATIETNLDGKIKRGLRMTDLASFRIKAVPDDLFRQTLPREAIYRVTEWSYQFASGARGKPEKTVTGTSRKNLMQEAQGAQRLIIEAKKVERKNYLGRWVPADFETKPIILPLIGT